MRPKKRKTMGSNDLFRARLDQIIDQQSFQLSVKIDTPGVMGPGSRPGRQQSSAPQANFGCGA